MPFSRELLKKTKCVSYILHIIFFFFFFFYRGKNHFNIIFYYFLSSTNSLAHFVRFTSQNNSNYPVQILLEWYFFQQHFFFFFPYTNPTPHRNRITRDDHLHSIFSSYASLYILVNHAWTFRCFNLGNRRDPKAAVTTCITFCLRLVELREIFFVALNHWCKWCRLLFSHVAPRHTRRTEWRDASQRLLIVHK